MSAGERTIEQGGPIGGDRNSVCPGLHWERSFALRTDSERFALHDGYERWICRSGWMTGELAPTLAAGKIDHNDSSRTIVRGVGDIGYASLPLAEIEPYIVEVGRLQHNAGGQDDRLDHLIGGEIHRYELGSAGLGLLEAWRGCVEDPQAVERVDHHALNADQGRARMGGDIGVDGGVRIGDGLAVAQFGHRERDVVAPPRVVDEDSPNARDRHARGHGVIEIGDGLDPTDRLLCGQARGRGDRPWGLRARDAAAGQDGPQRAGQPALFHHLRHGAISFVRRCLFSTPTKCVDLMRLSRISGGDRSDLPAEKWTVEARAWRLPAEGHPLILRDLGEKDLEVRNDVVRLPSRHLFNQSVYDGRPLGRKARTIYLPKRAIDRLRQ